MVASILIIMQLNFVICFLRADDLEYKELYVWLLVLSQK